MEDKANLSQNGQEVQQQDFNLVAEEAALADDRVFAELFRMIPYNGSAVAKGVIPFQDGAWKVSATNGVPRQWLLPGTGVLNVMPFRAFIGSRDTVGSDAKKNIRDIRSSVVVGFGSLAQPVTFTANVSGNPRWDLVYCAVSVEAGSGTVTRYVRNPASLVISATPVTVTTRNSFVLDKVTGTPGASPALPALPADAGGTYYIPLCYVLIPNGYNGATVLTSNNVWVVAPVVNMAPNSGAATVRPASHLYDPALPSLAPGSAAVTNWVAGTAPGWHLPPDSCGQESLILQWEFRGASSSWTIRNGETIDNTRNWAQRHFICTLFFATAGAGGNQFRNGDAGFLRSFDTLDLKNLPSLPSQQAMIQYGQSFKTGAQEAAGGGLGPIFYLNDSQLGFVAGIWAIGAYVDNSTPGGAMKCYIRGNPDYLEDSNGLILFAKIDSFCVNPVPKGT